MRWRFMKSASTQRGQQIEVAQHHHQTIAEVVGNAAGRLADHLNLVGLCPTIRGGRASTMGRCKWPAQHRTRSIVAPWGEQLANDTLHKRSYRTSADCRAPTGGQSSGGRYTGVAGQGVWIRCQDSSSLLCMRHPASRYRSPAPTAELDRASLLREPPLIVSLRTPAPGSRPTTSGTSPSPTLRAGPER